MKKRSVLLTLLVFVLVVFSITGAGAESMSDYTIENADLTLQLPSSMDVITRSTGTDSEVFRKHNATADELIKYNVYLQGFSEDNTMIFTLTVSEDKNSKNVDNYRELTEEQLDEIKESYISDQSCRTCSVDTYNDAVYFDTIVTRVENDHELYFAQADTVVNGRYVNFVLQSLNGDVDEVDKAFMANVLNSAVFRADNDKENSSIILLVTIIGSGLLVILIAVVISVIIKKNRRKSELKKLSSKMREDDKALQLERERSRRNRTTMTGAERPDAFFDGVDGIENSRNVDKLERTLIREAKEEKQNLSKSNYSSDEFIDIDKKQRKTKRKPKDKKTYNNKGNSSRKF